MVCQNYLSAPIMNTIAYRVFHASTEVNLNINQMIIKLFIIMIAYLLLGLKEVYIILMCLTPTNSSNNYL
jgi:hypothetical protein